MLDFVLGHYVDQGVAELDPAKLPDLLTLRCSGIVDAPAEFGDMARIREGFIGFQRHLYEA